MHPLTFRAGDDRRARDAGRYREREGTEDNQHVRGVRPPVILILRLRVDGRTDAEAGSERYPSVPPPASRRSLRSFTASDLKPSVLRSMPASNSYYFSAASAVVVGQAGGRSCQWPISKPGVPRTPHTLTEDDSGACRVALALRMLSSCAMRCQSAISGAGRRRGKQRYGAGGTSRSKFIPIT